MLQFASSRSGRILDYGCGGGEVVRAGLAEGIDICGCETFYEGGPHSRALAKDLIGSHVLPMKDSLIPFPARYFDCVVSNMVFEHLPDLDLALMEIYRVLLPGRSLLTMFPTREVWREGHCGIPFAHRLARLRLGYYWLLSGRALGAGRFKKGKTRRQWAADFQTWLNTYCFYRSASEIYRSFERHGFEVMSRDREYMNFRGIEWMPQWLFHHLGFRVIEAKRLN